MNTLRLLLSITLIFLSLQAYVQDLNVYLDGKRIDSWGATDSSKQISQIEGFKKKLWAKGFIFAGLDSITNIGFFFHKGSKVEAIETSSIRKLTKKARMEYELIINSGHPFAELVWDSLRMENEKLAASYHIRKGPFVEYDSIIFLSPLRTKEWFLRKTLGIDKGEAYSESSFSQLSRRIDQMSFMQVLSKPDVSFQNGRATTYLNLKESSTGNFQGVLGVFPNQQDGNRPLVTGSIDLSLGNLFRSGKELDFSWARFGEASQKLDVNYRHPFFARSGINLETELNVVKQDTSFLNVEYSLGGSWYAFDAFMVGFSYGRSRNSVLLADEDRIVSQRLLDLEQDWYGLSLRKESKPSDQLQDLFRFNVKMEIGQRAVQRNSSLPTTFYDSINLESVNGRFTGAIEFQKTLRNQLALYSVQRFGYLSGDQLANNQFFRLGGLSTLRGFNEQFFFTHSYLAIQSELRIFFEERSFLFAFWDQGVVRSESVDYPVGFGVGFSLDTTSGLFSFAMALGSNRDTPFDMTNTKVHFGYLSRF